MWWRTDIQRYYPATKKREISGFFCGQRYSWTKVFRIGLLAGFSSDLLALQKTTADIG